MLLAIVTIFIIGYLVIALEHPLRIDKAAVALLLGMLLWVLYAFGAESIVPVADAEELSHYLSSSTTLQSLPLAQQCLNFIVNVKVIEHLGDISEILFFLIGAMTIVELIDVHGGFSIITNRITTRKKRKLLWILGFITFFMSAILDNLTTAIVMVMLLRKLVSDQRERWLYASMIVIAANSGGAWSPIGDITTIMLWVKGNVTTSALVKFVLLPSMVSLIVPLIFASRMLGGTLAPVDTTVKTHSDFVSFGEKRLILILGILGLVFVPLFKAVTSLPPFIGILFSLSVLWIFTEIMYNRKMIDEAHQCRVPKVLKRIDIPTILFFLGILMAVAVLQATGILTSMAQWLDVNVHNVYVINILLGALSSIVDNVPLVAASIGMYPIVDPIMLSSVSDPAYMGYFVQDGIFWEFLSYCVGVGGSMLIIGSAAGVVVMGLERINFVWYLKHISLLALCGYLAGAFTYMAEVILFKGGL